MRDIVSIVLAAGHGTRMCSKVLKCQHKIGGLAIIDHLFLTLDNISSKKTALVISQEMKDNIKFDEKYSLIVQKDRLGTAHAVLEAQDYFSDATGDVLVLFGDNPLITVETIEKILKERKENDGVAIVVLGFRPDDPAKYGRLVLNEEGLLDKIVEFKDATDAEKEIKLCNSGIMCFDSKTMLKILEKIDDKNNANEYYLTDAVKIARIMGYRVAVVEGPADEMLGINSKRELAFAEESFQNRRRKEFMNKGVTLIDPKSVFFSYDTEIEGEIVVEPNVFFGPKVRIEEGVLIKGFSHIEGTTVRSGAIVGPFARLRPGTLIENDAHIGNFVEIKNSVIGIKSKINHLSYIGDSDVGKETNIGAGTVTCNYDGYFKYRTKIGDGVFVGSKTCIVAPVSLGNNSFTAAGSVITQNVPEDALAVGRGMQAIKEGWAKGYHKKQRGLKQQKK